MQKLLVTTLCTLCWIAFHTTAHADDTPPPQDAKTLFFQGNEQFTNGDYEAATDSFRRAYDAKPTWKLLYNIGQAEAAAKRYGLALEAFEAYVAQGGDEIKMERMTAVTEEISRLRMFVGVLNVKAPTDTELVIDGTRRGKTPFKGLIRVSVGDHQIVLTHNGVIVFDSIVSIAGGMTTSIEAQEDTVPQTPVTTPQGEEDASPSTANDADDTAEKDGQVAPLAETKRPGKPKKALLIGGIAASALGAGGLGVGVAFTVKAFGYDSERTDAVSAGDVTAAKKADDNLQTASTLMTVGYIAGGVLAAAGTTMLIVHFKKKKKSKVAVVPNVTGLQINF